jgi:hypothetical protein
MFTLPLTIFKMFFNLDKEKCSATNYLILLKCSMYSLSTFKVKESEKKSHRNQM